MPVALTPPISRRKFFIQFSVLTGSLSVPHLFFANRSQATKTTHWAFMADTHIPEIDDSTTPPKRLQYYNPHQNLKRAVEQILKVKPDCVAILGDLARLEGKTGDYLKLKKILSPLMERIPVFLALGNHDNRRNFTTIFNTNLKERQPVSGKFVLVVESPPIRIILLDSLLFTNKVPGLLGKKQRTWLKDFLSSAPPTTTFLGVHHTLEDGDGDLLDVDRLFRIIEPFRHVKAIFYGHSHELHFDEYRGIHLINIPGMGYSFNPEEPVGWMQAELSASGGNFQFHAIAGSVTAEMKRKSLSWR